LVNSAKTEMQVHEEMDKKRFSTSAHGRGATPYTETVEYHLHNYDLCCLSFELSNSFTSYWRIQDLYTVFKHLYSVVTKKLQITKQLIEALRG